MDRRHGCQKQRASWGPTLVPPLPQPHASVSPSPVPLMTFLESVPSPASRHPLPASDYPINSETCCPHLSQTAPLKASRCCTGPRAGRGLGRRLPNTGLLPLGSLACWSQERAGSHGCWIMELVQVTPNTPGVQSLGGEQERLFVATVSGSRLKSNRCAGVRGPC